MDLIYNKETGQWEEHVEPFATVEFATRADFERLKEMVAFWNEHHPDDRTDDAVLKSWEPPEEEA